MPASFTPQLQPSRPQPYSHAPIGDRPITCPACSCGGLVLKHLPMTTDKASLRSNPLAPGSSSSTSPATPAARKKPSPWAPMPKASPFTLQTRTCPHSSSGQDKTNSQMAAERVAKKSGPRWQEQSHVCRAVLLG